MGGIDGNIGGYARKFRIDGVSVGNFEKVLERLGILRKGLKEVGSVRIDYARDRLVSRIDSKNRDN